MEKACICPIFKSGVSSDITNLSTYLPIREIYKNKSGVFHALYFWVTGQKKVDTVYTDFGKAFDQIDHFILLNKFWLFRFSNILLRLLSSYNSDRDQVVF